MAQQQNNILSDEKVLLKTSFFGGFEKKEVLEYIDKLREQNRVMGKELEDRMGEVSNARNELSAQVSSFEAKLSEMERQLEERGGKVKELSGQVDTLKGEVSRQKQRVVEQEMQLNQQKDRNMKLALQAQNLEYKAKRYEDFSAQIGDILLEAKLNADETIMQAEQKAEQIKHNAVAANEQITNSLNAMRREIKDVRSQLESIMKDFIARIDEIDRSLEEAVSSAETASESDEDKLGDILPKAQYKPEAVAEGTAEEKFFR